MSILLVCCNNKKAGRGGGRENIAAISDLTLLKFMTNCSGLKIDWGSPSVVQLPTECILFHYILLFYTAKKTPSPACKQLTMMSSQATDITIQCLCLRHLICWGQIIYWGIELMVVWIILNLLYLSLNKSPNCAMCTSLQYSGWDR